MIISEELQELMLIIDQEGLSHLVGDMLAYALAPAVSRWGDDADGEDRTEPSNPLERAIEFLQFQLVVAENQIKEAEEVASTIQDGSETPIQFNPARLDDIDAQEESVDPIFASMKRSEEWSTTSEREEVINNLDSLLKEIKSI